MEALATDTERGQLMLRPSPRPMLTSDMVDSTAMVLVWAMAAMAMEVLATTARGLLRPSLRLMLTSDGGLYGYGLGLGYGGYGYGGLGYGYGKRSADAEADAYLGYGGLYGYGLGLGYGYGGYGGLGYYGKRSAEAKPEADAYLGWWTLWLRSWSGLW